jgi:hypothetical protein
MGYWIARKTQKIKRGKGYVVIKPGDPVPEAECWPNRDAWERMGYVQYLNRPMPTDVQDVPLAIPEAEIPPREVFPRSATARKKTSEKQAETKMKAEREKTFEKSEPVIVEKPSVKSEPVVEIKKKGHKGK